MIFEWHEDKRLANSVKHGVSFEDAAFAFDGRRCVEVASDRFGEMRHARTALVNNVMITVVWTPRGSVVRLISARRARDVEKRRYYAYFAI
jgi:uncharacterized DUF497 family protein